jgi:hypothetical protein
VGGGGGVGGEGEKVLQFFPREVDGFSLMQLLGIDDGAAQPLLRDLSLGGFHDQADAKWVVIRRSLRGGLRATNPRAVYRPARG